MIVNETKEKIEIFAKHFCDFCKKQFYPTPYRVEGKCQICNQDVCRQCSTELQTNICSYDGDFSWKTFCLDCNKSLDIYNHVVNTAAQEMDDAEDRRDRAIANRWSVIQQLKAKHESSSSL